MVDLWRDFWIRETGTDQQVAQLHERYMIIMMMKDIWILTEEILQFFFNFLDHKIHAEVITPKHVILITTECLKWRMNEIVG